MARKALKLLARGFFPPRLHREGRRFESVTAYQPSLCDFGSASQGGIPGQGRVAPREQFRAKYRHLLMA
jgi:hypothetical protein